MKRLQNILMVFTAAFISCSCSAEEKKEPHIWVTLSDLTSGKPVDGFYVHFKKVSDTRYDLMISGVPLIFRGDQLVNEDAVIAPEEIEVYTNPHQWFELNYRKDSRNSRSFVRARHDGLVENYPIEIEFYDQNNNRRAIFLIKDLAMKTRFFPHY